MKQWKMTVSTLLVAAVLGSGVAHAEVVTVVTAGTINSGYDFLGLFGQSGRNLTGLSYTQTISANIDDTFTAGGNSHYQHLVKGDSATLYGTTVVAGVSYQWTIANARVDAQMAKFLSDGFSGYNDQFYLGGTNFDNEHTGAPTAYMENSVYSFSQPFVSNLSLNQHITPNVGGLAHQAVFLIQTDTQSTSFQASTNLTYAALNPVPEPETYALMGAGLVLLTAAVRRRRRA